jgi:hypothetical protein
MAGVPARVSEQRLAARLEAEREMLLLRLDGLRDNARQKPGYKTALRLLNPMFRRADLAARTAILQAATFMIDVLEMMPPIL